MVDGIKSVMVPPNFEAWKEATNISFNVTANLETGEKVPKKKRRERSKDLPYQTYVGKTDFETYFLVHKETIWNEKISHIVILEGSLHKNFFGSANFLPFKWEDL